MLLLLPYDLQAQSAVSGLGKYVIGVTTPDSLNRTEFNEQQQPLVKGTIAFPCAHIRLFTADSVEIEDVTIASLSLIFYDNQLFRISCAYNARLEQTFIRWHGKGVSRPQSRLFLCGQGKEKAMTLRGETWASGDRLAVTMHATGYNADCQLEQVDWLLIASQSVSDLSSDCALQASDLFSEEFDRVLNGQ